MRLNTISPAKGAKTAPKRLGRGIGSGLGKTCGRGHKGQRARAGGYHKIGFEGGQMPIQRRLPKFGFVSKLAAKTTEIRLSDLAKVTDKTINMETLRAANVINSIFKRVKIIGTGEITKPVHVVGIKVTKGAKAAIEKAGGKVEE